MHVTVEITDAQIENLIISALEGGAHYWYEIQSMCRPPKLVYRTDPNKVFAHVDYPMNAGGHLMIKQYVDPDGPGVRKFNRAAIDRGLQVLADSAEYKHHFTDILNDDTDATTGDIFLQFCLYGEVLYG